SSERGSSLPGGTCGSAAGAVAASAGAVGATGTGTGAATTATCGAGAADLCTTGAGSSGRISSHSSTTRATRIATPPVMSHFAMGDILPPNAQCQGQPL